MVVMEQLYCLSRLSNMFYKIESKSKSYHREDIIDQQQGPIYT